MKQKQIIKRIVDVAMLIMLPALMSEILTGQQVHEWFGICMVFLFVMHHILNLSWMRNLVQGTYSPPRCGGGTVLNLLLLIDFLALAFSGIRMSGYVFVWLPFSGGMRTARTLHLFASYW